MYWCVKLRARCIHERPGCSGCRLTQFRAPARRVGRLQPSQTTRGHPDERSRQSPTDPENITILLILKFVYRILFEPISFEIHCSYIQCYVRNTASGSDYYWIVFARADEVLSKSIQWRFYNLFVLKHL